MTDPHKSDRRWSALSPAGEVRREAILGRLQSAQAWRRRRRHTLQAAAISVPVILLAFAAMQLRHRPAPAPRPFAGSGPPARSPLPPVPEGAAPRPAETPRAIPRIELVATDPGILDRFALKSSPPPPEAYIGDDELMALMTEAGEPTGIIRAKGRVLLSADLRPREEPPGPGSRGPDPFPPDQG